MRVYIAAKYTARCRLRAVRARLCALGLECQSAWMDQDDGDYSVPDERAVEESRRSFADVDASDVLAIDTIDASETGGREVEYGAYWAGRAGRPPFVIVVGPVRNVFHALAHARVARWSQALRILDAMTRKDSG